MASATDAEQGSPVKNAVKPPWRLQIPLALLLLGTMMFVAAAIAIPVAALAYQGASDTVDEILGVLRKNYVRQVEDKVTATTSVVYELIQSNADNLSIRKIVDNLTPTTDFLAHPDLVYSYHKSIQRSDFIRSAGFVQADGNNLILVAQRTQQGMICRANSTVPAGRWCEALIVNKVLSGTVETVTAPSFQPPKKVDSLTNTIGVWDSRVTWVVYNREPLRFFGIIGFAWNQWKNQPLGANDAGPAGGVQVMSGQVGKFSQLLRGIETTANTAIAIWDTNSGELIATNGAAETLNVASIIEVGPKFYQGSTYLPGEYPSPYLAASANALVKKYGSLAALPKSSSDTFEGKDGRLFVETRAMVDAFGLQWTLMIAIPEADLLGSIAASRKRVIGTSVGVGVAMLAFAVAIAWLITMPLRRLTEVMSQATDMDFSAIRSGFLEKKSRVKELAVMEQVRAPSAQNISSLLADGLSSPARYAIQHSFTHA
ncbi:hypothetical protein PhCBS80983_g06231 [Powellomyces hirtus]|uniref:Cache domain-containing protein n=1 Tax=Powellomyces hirtus TaxID=109895 RepID=A0A507DPS9_9FUNG|nr:hypothetical protein PhCBS80983_g06231 [Powellomyces hirtus]